MPQVFTKPDSCLLAEGTIIKNSLQFFLEYFVTVVAKNMYWFSTQFQQETNNTDN
jgi:hypothetical protein